VAAASVPLLVLALLAATHVPGLGGRLVAATPTAAVATAQPAAAVAEVRLDRLEPAVASPGDELRLSGTVTNTSDQVQRDVQALLRLSHDALQERAEVRQVAADPAFRSGVRDTSTFVELGDLAPGASTAFSVRTDVDRLALPGPGVYVVGVDVRATSADGSRGTVGIARTELAWVPAEGPDPIDVATVLPLATEPALLPDGTLFGDDVAAAVSPTGPLGGRLAAGSAAGGGVPVTWLVDPDLVTTLTAMAGGYDVRTPAPGSSAASRDTHEGSGSEAAARFLARLAEAVETGPEPRRLPTADPDIAALAAAADRGWAVDTLRGALRGPGDLTDVLGRSAPLAVAPAAAGLGAGGADLLAQAGGADVVVGDAGLRAALTPRDPGVSPQLATRQRILAETYLAAGEPAGQGAGLLTLLAPPTWSGGAAETATVLAALRAAPWVRTVPRTTPAVPEDATGSPGRPLPAGHVAAVADLHDDVQGVSGLLADPAVLLDRFDAAELRALSVAWRADLDGATGYLRTAQGQLRTSTTGVQVLVPDSVTLSARSGRFPLTVANDLAADVVVRVDLTSANRDRLAIADPPELHLAAGEKATVTVQAEAAANGRVPVQVQLRAADGAAFGPSQTMIVVATQYGTVGWLVVAAGATLLLATAGRRLVRRVRARHAAGWSTPAGSERAGGPGPGDGAGGAARPVPTADAAAGPRGGDPGSSEVIR
jgi:hypothetical protein